MGKKQLTDAELDALFEQEQAPKAAPDALMARIMADADAVQNSAQAAPKPSAAPQPSLSFWRFLPTAGALTACVCAGLFIGLSTELPTSLGVTASTELTFSDAWSGLSDFDTLIAEEQS